MKLFVAAMGASNYTYVRPARARDCEIVAHDRLKSLLTIPEIRAHDSRETRN
ncbi:hypothetical protein [Bradyrhizobium sp. CW10]|uniref:hypothetical protein n=1 Tax=Bradyrhizobium sp. CW10 TaxID=2782683 RepID=UPI001FFB58B2|nr:hypothetical protein [Bradyrhizobium sp. CW10]MCK1469875.1 hypothetical protein [Bradyrhizobium sp. CW10]